MKNFFKNLTDERAEKLRKLILLAVSAASAILVFVLLFVPYASYTPLTIEEATESLLRPSEAFQLLQDEAFVLDGVAYLALALFLVVLVFVIIGFVFFMQVVFGFFRSEKKLSKSARTLVVFASIVTGVYFISSLAVCAIIRATGGTMYATNNFVPFIFMMLIDIVYAVLTGLLRARNKQVLIEQEEKEEKKEKLRSDGKAIYKARAELFLYVLVLFGLTLGALLSNIVTVDYTSNYGKVPSVNLTGVDMFKRYAELDGGGQVVAFILFTMLLIVCTLFFLSLVSYISRSALYYHLSIASIAVGAVCCLLVGLFGKYYEIVQKLNETTIVSMIESTSGLTIDLGLEFQVKSTSIWFFVVSVIALAALLVRNPYTRGVTIERRLAAEAARGTQTIQGEISISDLPNAKTLNSGAVVSTDQTTGKEIVLFSDPCPAFTELDAKIPAFKKELEEKRQSLFEAPTLPKLVQFIVSYARDSRLHLSYTEEDIATFVAGLGTTKLTILQGMSGTGKTSLPKIFAEALNARCEIVEVESSWRDKNELLGYYNEFSKTYTPKKFTQALYRAKLNPETLTFIVLDEMNLSRIEYYFSDFLSLMENEPDKRELKLLNVGLYRTENGEKVAYEGLSEGHNLKIPANVWFVGTANRDESTFEISDKVYDRAHTMNFNKRAAKVLYYNDPIPQRFLPVEILEKLFTEAKKAMDFNIDADPVIGEVEKLLSPYNISFGNRIAMQIESFVSVYCSCFAMSESVIRTAVEKILLSKVVSKLELKSVDNKEQLAAEFEKLGLYKCSEFILKLNED